MVQLGCVLFSNLYGLNAILIRLDELRSGDTKLFEICQREVAPHRHSLFSHVDVTCTVVIGR